MRKKWLATIGLLAAMMLVAAACNGDGEDGDGAIRNAGDLRDIIALLGADGLLSDTFVSIANTRGMLLTGPAQSEAEGYQDFLQKYEEKAGGPPIQGFHAHAYDAVNMLLDSIEAVADEAPDGTLTIGRQDLRDEMYAIEGFEGLTGTLSCNDFGDCANPRISVYENADPQQGLSALFANPVATVDFTEEIQGGIPPQPKAEPAEGEVVVGPDDPVKIAAHQALTGDFASLGLDQVTAIEVAIDDRGGELLGHPIELTQEDDTCGEEGGTTGANRIVADEQIIGVVGTSCSGAGVPASGIYSEAGLVMISGSATSPAFTLLGYLSEGDAEPQENWVPGFYRVSHNDEFQGAAAGRFLFEELGVQTLATIHDGDPYTEGLATQAGQFFEDAGGEVVLATAISKGDTDMRPVLTEVRESGAEALYFPIFQPEGDFIVAQSLEIFG